MLGVMARAVASWRLWPVLLSCGMVAGGFGLVYIASPDLVTSTALGPAFSTAMERLWAVAYTAGGLLVVVGVIRPQRWWELMGLLLLSACFLGYAYAVWRLRDFRSASVVLPVFTALGVGCTARAFLLRYRV
jgi:lysylphosphatidylglycerol synthetase-like protein (DUF2156 family)